jgi:hypothetical protein
VIVFVQPERESLKMKGKVIVFVLKIDQTMLFIAFVNEYRLKRYDKCHLLANSEQLLSLCLHP